MKKLIQSLLIVAALAAPQMAQATSGKVGKGWTVCLSENAFDLWTTAVSRNDERLGQQLIKSQQCVILPRDVDYSLIDQTWDGVAEVYIYIGSNSFRVFTYTEALK